MTDATVSIAAIEAARADVIRYVNKRFDELIESDDPGGASTAIIYKLPSLEDGRDPRNKDGLNLTARGEEILYRMFDDDAGYNRSAKILSISQNAAKNRKKMWEKAGGKTRTKMALDIDR